MTTTRRTPAEREASSREARLIVAAERPLASTANFEAVISARDIVGRETEQVLRVQVVAQFLDRTLKTLQLGETECGSARSGCQRLNGIGLADAGDFVHGAQEIDALFGRG